MQEYVKDKSLNKQQWRKSLKDQDLGKRLLVGLIMLVCLAGFLHFREIRIEILEPGSIAKNYVVAQIDFEFTDHDSTSVLKQEALKDIGSIYQVDEKEIKDRRVHFENYLIYHQSWRDQAEDSTFEEINAIADKVEDHFFTARFTDLRTLKKMQELDVNADEYFLVPPHKGMASILPVEFWEAILADLDKKSYPKKSAQFVVNYFEKFQWIFEVDLSAQKKLQEIVEGSVPEKIRKIRSGSRIIDQGERVTPKQIVMLQAMKDALAENRKLWQPLTIMGSLFFSLFIILLGAYYFKWNHRDILQSLSKLSLYVSIVILTLAFAKLSEFILLRNGSSVLELIRYPLFIPFAAILLTVLLGSEVALFTCCFLSVLLGISLAVDLNRFLIINLILGVVAIIFSRDLRKRKEVFAVCGKIWLSGIPVLFSYNFIRNNFWSMTLIGDVVSTFCFMVLTSILVIGLLPILESVFHVMTDMSLMEYMDPSNELLRRLSVEAPGTYQHSLVVGTIAEAAAQAIGARGFFCRVSTLYHDIGKLINPHYFTENQMGGFNIHQLLTPIESSQVIMAHVPEGETLARKYKLPQSFIDIIKEHHGTTLVYYFYCKQVEQMGGDVDAVDENLFRYLGPKPKTKESAIIMIADSIEAASRALDEISEESLTEMVERIVADKQEEKQLDDCQLTFEELGMVKKSIVRTLSVTRHIRVKYPEKRR
ncbi:MAG: HDIG domain-containing metalloprotein [Chlamydiota bacterium]